VRKNPEESGNSSGQNRAMVPSDDLHSGVSEPAETDIGGSLPVLVFFVLACAFSWA
jgi:hypothetical protein